MSPTDLDRFKAACVYPGRLDEQAVERELAAFLRALGINRQIVRLRAGWQLDDHPALRRNVQWIAEEWVKSNPAARDALSGLDVCTGHYCPPLHAAPLTPYSRADYAARFARDAREAGEARAALDAGAVAAACWPPAARDWQFVLGALDARDAIAALAALGAPDTLAALAAGAARGGAAAVAALGVPDTRAALDAIAALVALDTYYARAALQQFAAWCFQAYGWWWCRDVSAIVTQYFAAVELRMPAIEAWSRPLLEAFVAGCWLLYWADDTLYWVAKPTVHRDPGTPRLHHDAHAAVKSDIANLYFWRGVRVPPFVILRPDLITIAGIDREQNAEIRRVMIERYRHGEEIHGAAAFVRDGRGECLDHDQYGTLWRRNIPRDEPIVMIEVVNRSREPDGSFRRYWLRVPPTMRTARAAVAWTFDVPAKRYAPDIET